MIDDKIHYFLSMQKEGLIEANSILELLILYYKWTESGVCIIRDVEANLIPLKLNRAQKKTLVTMMDMALKKMPIRVIVLKARKLGISTFIQSLIVFLCAHCDNRIGVTIAHEASATKEIFEIPRLIIQYYPISAKTTREELSFPENSSRYFLDMDSIYR